MPRGLGYYRAISWHSNDNTVQFGTVRIWQNEFKSI